MPATSDAVVFIDRYACLSSGAGCTFGSCRSDSPLVACVLSREWVIGLFGAGLTSRSVWVKTRRRFYRPVCGPTGWVSTRRVCGRRRHTRDHAHGLREWKPWCLLSYAPIWNCCVTNCSSVGPRL